METVAKLLTNAGWTRLDDHQPVNETPRMVFSHDDRRAYVAPAWTIFYDKTPTGIELLRSVKTAHAGTVEATAREITPVARPTQR